MITLGIWISTSRNKLVSLARDQLIFSLLCVDGKKPSVSTSVIVTEAFSNKTRRMTNVLIVTFIFVLKNEKETLIWGRRHLVYPSAEQMQMLNRFYKNNIKQ